MSAVASVQQPSAGSIHHDDFAYLSDDIVFDVLQVAHFERLRENFYKLKPFGGRWGELAHKFRDFRLKCNEIEESRLDGNSESFTAAAKNRKNVSVNSLRFSEKSNFNETEHLGADAYESLRVYGTVIPKEFLEKLGTRFTSIIWWNGEGRTTGEIDFLKRQLKSPHLRILECNSPVLTRPEFTDFLVDFVRKKNFETLTVTPFSIFSSISERVFFAAYEAWLQRREGEHLRSWISAWISTENLRKLIARIPNCSWNQRINLSRKRYSEKHPTADHYKMLMYYKDLKVARFDVKELQMSLSENAVNDSLNQRTH